MGEKEERLRNLALRVAKQTLRLTSILESSTDCISENTRYQLDEILSVIRSVETAYTQLCEMSTMKKMFRSKKVTQQITTLDIQFQDLIADLTATVSLNNEVSISLLRDMATSTHAKILDLCEDCSGAHHPGTIQQGELRLIRREEFQCTTLLPVHVYSYKKDCPLARVHRSQGRLNDGSMVVVKAFKGMSKDSGTQAFNRERDSTVAELNPLILQIFGCSPLNTGIPYLIFKYPPGQQRQGFWDFWTRHQTGDPLQCALLVLSLGWQDVFSSVPFDEEETDEEVLRNWLNSVAVDSNQLEEMALSSLVYIGEIGSFATEQMAQLSWFRFVNWISVNLIFWSSDDVPSWLPILVSRVRWDDPTSHRVSSGLLQSADFNLDNLLKHLYEVGWLNIQKPRVIANGLTIDLGERWYWNKIGRYEVLCHRRLELHTGCIQMDWFQWFEDLSEGDRVTVCECKDADHENGPPIALNDFRVEWVE